MEDLSNGSPGNIRGLDSRREEANKSDDRRYMFERTKRLSVGRLTILGAGAVLVADVS
jgi:hypothetical protein